MALITIDCATLFVLLKRPLYMLGDECGIRMQTSFERPYNFFAGLGIAQGNCDVAQPTIVADSTYGAAFGYLEPGRFTQCEQLSQICRVESMPRCEVAFARRLRELVPRAAQLTVVATIDSVADRLAKLDRNRAPQLNGQV